VPAKRLPGLCQIIGSAICLRPSAGGIRLTTPGPHAEFFARLLERRSLAIADPSRGRFRSFILTSNEPFSGEAPGKASAQTWGSREILSLDLAAAERRYDWNQR